MLSLGWAFGCLLKEAMPQQAPVVVIARDTRASGQFIEAALTAGLHAVGVDVVTLGVMPTPVVPYYLEKIQASGGGMITASHNQAADNGVKIFCQSGDKIDNDWGDRLIARMAMPYQIQAGQIFGVRHTAQLEAKHAYVQHLLEITKHYSHVFQGKHVVIDPANGASFQLAEAVLTALGCKVSMIHNQPDGYNINAECGSTAPQALQQQVLALQADFGIALDGDGDRVIVVDHQGHVFDGEDILYILATLDPSKQKVVTTTMANQGLVDALKAQGIEVTITDVGDIHVRAAMLSTGAMLGAENNGHVIIRPYNRASDGIVTAVVLMGQVLHAGHRLQDFYQAFTRHPQVLVNIAFKDQDGCEQIKQSVAQQLSDFPRINAMIRQSGTENQLRVCLRSRPGDHNQLADLAQQLGQLQDVK